MPPVPLTARTDSFLSKRVLLACLILIAAIVTVYAPVRHFGFLQWDDPDYVTDNVHVAQGLTWQGARWALTSSDAANWHPVTWLSHMLDVQLYGMNAGPQHVTSLLIHILNALLLFGLLYRMTGAWGRSMFVAGLFAVHPLHVESVAWISERKDVLSTLFWMLAMWAYVAYVRRPGLWRYLLVVLWFGLGLMAKPMLVTLPFVLLLLDVWPLRRVDLGGGAGRSGLAALRRQGPGLLRLLREKLPLFALAAISSVVTLLAQRHEGAIFGLEGLPLGLRLANALASYLAYIGKMLWPVRLAAFYPIPTSTPIWQASLGALVLIGVTVLAIRAGRRRAYFLVGWLWYVGTLIPVIGLVQVGNQSMADRYTYVPLIGLFLIIAWGAAELAARWRPSRLALPVAAVCVGLACAAVARAQVRYWGDGIALWEHALDVTDDNAKAQDNLGVALDHQGRFDEAVQHLVEAVRLKPDVAETHDNLGVALAHQGKLDEAVQHLVEAVRLKPDYAEAQNNLGLALMYQGKLDEAVQHLVEAVRLNPDVAEAQNNLGVALAHQGKLDEAVQHFVAALRIKPNFAGAHDNLKAAQAIQGKHADS
jgi:Flp pilus assembly protein TadD